MKGGLIGPEREWLVPLVQPIPCCLEKKVNRMNFHSYLVYGKTEFCVSIANKNRIHVDAMNMYLFQTTFLLCKLFLSNLIIMLSLLDNSLLLCRACGGVTTGTSGKRRRTK